MNVTYFYKRWRRTEGNKVVFMGNRQSGKEFFDSLPSVAEEGEKERINDMMKLIIANWKPRMREQISKGERCLDLFLISGGKIADPLWKKQIKAYHLHALAEKIQKEIEPGQLTSYEESSGARVYQVCMKAQK